MIGLPEPAAFAPPAWAASWFPVAIDSAETEPDEPVVVALCSRPRNLSMKDGFAESDTAESLARFLRLKNLSVRDGFFRCSSSCLDMVMRVGRETQRVRRWLSLSIAMPIRELLRPGITVILECSLNTKSQSKY